jgi:MarR family 2-MHQ and catechol resistance regulon transcriptional repressor
MRASEAVTTGAHRHLAEEDLTVTQFGVLEALYHLGPMCQRDVARKNLKSTANITTVVDNLEKRGLVERRRSSEDRRYIALHLTETGRSLIERIFPRHLEGIVSRFSVLTPDEQNELARLCKKLGKSKA